MHGSGSHLHLDRSVDYSTEAAFLRRSVFMRYRDPRVERDFVRFARVPFLYLQPVVQWLATAILILVAAALYDPEADSGGSFGILASCAVHAGLSLLETVVMAIRRKKSPNDASQASLLAVEEFCAAAFVLVGGATSSVLGHAVRRRGHALGRSFAEPVSFDQQVVPSIGICSVLLTLAACWPRFAHLVPTVVVSVLLIPLRWIVLTNSNNQTESAQVIAAVVIPELAMYCVLLMLMATVEHAQRRRFESYAASIFQIRSARRIARKTDAVFARMPRFLCPRVADPTQALDESPRGVVVIVAIDDVARLCSAMQPHDAAEAVELFWRDVRRIGNSVPEVVIVRAGSGHLLAVANLLSDCGDAVQLALRFAYACQRRAAGNVTGLDDKAMRLRIAIAEGPVYGAVVGATFLRYDLFGATVAEAWDLLGRCAVDDIVVNNQAIATAGLKTVFREGTEVSAVVRQQQPQQHLQHQQLQQFEAQLHRSQSCDDAEMPRGGSVPSLPLVMPVADGGSPVAGPADVLVLDGGGGLAPDERSENPLSPLAWQPGNGGHASSVASRSSSVSSASDERSWHPAAVHIAIRRRVFPLTETTERLHVSYLCDLTDRLAIRQAWVATAFEDSEMERLFQEHFRSLARVWSPMTFAVVVVVVAQLVSSLVQQVPRLGDAVLLQVLALVSSLVGVFFKTLDESTRWRGAFTGIPVGVAFLLLFVAGAVSRPSVIGNDATYLVASFTVVFVLTLAENTPNATTWGYPMYLISVVVPYFVLFALQRGQLLFDGVLTTLLIGAVCFPFCVAKFLACARGHYANTLLAEAAAEIVHRELEQQRDLRDVQLPAPAQKIATGLGMFFGSTNANCVAVRVRLDALSRPFSDPLQRMREVEHTILLAENAFRMYAGRSVHIVKVCGDQLTAAGPFEDVGANAATALAAGAAAENGVVGASGSGLSGGGASGVGGAAASFSGPCSPAHPTGGSFTMGNRSTSSQNGPSATGGANPFGGVTVTVAKTRSSSFMASGGGSTASPLLGGGGGGGAAAAAATAAAAGLSAESSSRIVSFFAICEVLGALHALRSRAVQMSAAVVLDSARLIVNSDDIGVELVGTAPNIAAGLLAVAPAGSLLMSERCRQLFEAERGRLVPSPGFILPATLGGSTSGAVHSASNIQQALLSGAGRSATVGQALLSAAGRSSVNTTGGSSYIGPDARGTSLSGMKAMLEVSFDDVNDPWRVRGVGLQRVAYFRFPFTAAPNAQSGRATGDSSVNTRQTWGTAPIDRNGELVLERSQ